MLFWIFDLDNTLYQIDRKSFRYESLVRNQELIRQLNELPCKKNIFTNATMVHTKLCLERIEILNKFDTIIHRDLISDIKPNLTAFSKMMVLSGITSKDKCVFFDDMLENLISAKRIGWITIYINKNIISHPFIDYSFSNIETALEYFLNIIKTHKS